MWDRPAQAVTFVENHDVVRDSPIINDKALAYAFILTHEGYPCVFWQDYFNWDLAQPKNQSGIHALVKVHEQNAAGPTQVLFVNDDLYVMQRLGDGDQSGLIFVLNNRGTWNGTWIQTQWNNTRLAPAAGAGAMILASRKKNGLTSPAGSIFGRRRAATRCTCRGEKENCAAFSG